MILRSVYIVIVEQKVINTKGNYDYETVFIFIIMGSFNNRHDWL